MHPAYVTVYTWEWEPIGQVTIDLDHLYRDGQIDRSELDDVAKKVATPLLEGKDIKDIHVFIHDGDPHTPEDLKEAAMEYFAKNGPHVESWGRNRRIRKTEPLRRNGCRPPSGGVG